VACCAFAAFLLMQLLAPFAWLRERLFGTPAERMSAAVAWNPGGAAAIAPARRTSSWGRGLLLLAVVEVAVIAAGYGYLQADRHAVAQASLVQALHASWCGSGPLDIDLAGWGN